MTDVTLIVLSSMVFLHIIDDFVLQTKLADMKQISWWKIHAPASIYRNDYKLCLLAHGYEWAFMMMIPVVFAMGFDLGWMWVMLPVNATVHAAIDHAKANDMALNLWQDQMLHLGQILLTFILYLFA